MHMETCLFGSWVRLNLTLSSMIPKKPKNHMERNKFSTLRTASKQPLLLDRRILVQLYLNGLSIQVWLKIEPHEAGWYPLGTSSVDRYIYSTIPTDQKAVLLYSQLVALLRRKLKRNIIWTTENSEEQAQTNTQRIVKNEKEEQVWVALQIVSKPFIFHSVLVTRTSSDLFTIKRNVWPLIINWLPPLTGK